MRNASSTADYRNTVELYTYIYSKLNAERKLTADYRNTVELLQKERDGLKKDLSAFAAKYESLLKSASKSDSLSAELLKRDAELKKLGERSAGLDLALTKLRQENTALAEEARKAAEELRSVRTRMEQRLAAFRPIPIKSPERTRPSKKRPPLSNSRWKNPLKSNGKPRPSPRKTPGSRRSLPI